MAGQFFCETYTEGRIIKGSKILSIEVLYSCCPEVVVTCNECYCITCFGITASFRGEVYVFIFRSSLSNIFG